MDILKDNAFFNRRLHSLLGVFPVGLFLLEHFFTNSFALKGAASYNDKIAFFESLPYLIAIEIVFIFIPILFHGIYGMYIVYTGQANQLQYGYFRNWMYMIQRVTGVILLFYIGWHVYTTRISHFIFGTEVSFQLIQDIIASPVAFWWMVIGVVSASFHFANGLWSFCIVWGITIGPKAQQRFGYLMLAFAVVLSGVGIYALTAFMG